MEKEGTIVREDDLNPTGKASPSKLSGEINPHHMYRLYFKSLISEESTEFLAGFGVAICDDKDTLLFHMKEQIHDSHITVLEADITALNRGLTTAIGLGINHISIYCDQLLLYDLVTRRSTSEQENIALLINEVKRIRQQLKFSIPVLVTTDQTRFAYKLAMEAIVSEIRIDMVNETCPICFEDGFKAEQMFSVGKCGHQFCLECMRHHIQVTLLEGRVPRCLHHQCESTLTLTTCDFLLTPKLKAIWNQRIEEESIPVLDRVYCPNPMCSALMSETEFSKEDGGRSYCVKCGEPFCINCKVTWHSNLSCEDYKKLDPNHSENDIKLIVLGNRNMWRQCGNCSHMIERSEGCNKITCRCGYKFCYTCGEKWKLRGCSHQDSLYNVFFSVLFVVLLFILWIYGLTRSNAT